MERITNIPSNIPSDASRIRAAVEIALSREAAVTCFDEAPNAFIVTFQAGGRVLVTVTDSPEESNEMRRNS